MSEKRKKEERASNAAFKSDEMARLAMELWWNTSSGIRAKFSKIEQSQGWAKFRHEYDKPENIKKRIEEWHLSRRWKGFSPELLTIIELAEKATNGNVLAGKELGNAILAIVEGRESFNDFVESVKLQRERESGVSEATWALKRFVERTNGEKLPTREDLNREAYLIKNLKVREVPLRIWTEKHSLFDEFEPGQRLDGDCIYWMNRS